MTDATDFVMKRKLRYVHPDGTVIDTAVNTEMEGFEDWLEHMVKLDPEIIWFFTVETTDIFDDGGMRTPEQWCALLGARIMDPDGWRGPGSRPWTDRITRKEFDRRLSMCTVDSRGYMPYVN